MGSSSKLSEALTLVGLFTSSLRKPSCSTAGNSSKTTFGGLELDRVADRGLSDVGEVVIGADDSNLLKDFVFFTTGLCNGSGKDMSREFALCWML